VMVDRTFSWTGCYIGGNVGSAIRRYKPTTTVTNAAGVPLTDVVSLGINALDSANLRLDGFTGGGQIGCNYQTGNFVFGIEADFNAFDPNQSVSQTATGTIVGIITGTASNTVRTDWLITARPRIGYAWDTFLLYATGGLAVTNVKFSTSYSNSVGEFESASFDTNAIGWTVGGGFEYALTRNWTTKVEYLYADFGSPSISAFINSGSTNPSLFNHKVSLTANMVRIGANYKFDWGGPVVARY
jgi:outer membrane immunogenic protein